MTREIRLAVASLVLVGLTAVVTSAAPITYAVNDTIGNGSVIGTVQTDGTIGVLGTGNILAWDLTLTGGGMVYQLTNATSAVLIVGADAMATATAISFNYGGAAGSLLLFQQGIFSGSHYWCHATTDGACFRGASVSPDAFNDPSFQLQQRTGTVSVATEADSVPEPAATALISFGLAALGLSRKRQRHGR